MPHNYNCSMQDEKQRIRDLKQECESVVSALGLGEKENELHSLEAKSTDPDFWADQENARVVMQKIADLKDEIVEAKSLKEDVDMLFSLAEEGSGGLGQEITSLETRLNKFKIYSFFTSSADKQSAIVAIHAGQGGVEAMDWAGMLFRMYSRWCERRGWGMKVIDETPGEEAGIKSITLSVSGSYAYGYLKKESGTHRLVRQSPFNADKLRQTSFALVEILPELAEAEPGEIEIKDEDLDWQFFRSSSQGGQNVQKVSTAVRLKHIPTGLVVTAQSERFQEQNRKNALTLLRAKLWLLAQEQKAKELKDIKGEYHPASWGTQIRSYVLHPYKMVKDLRTGVETSNAEAVLDGELDQFIEAEVKQVALG